MTSNLIKFISINLNNRNNSNKSLENINYKPIFNALNFEENNILEILIQSLKKKKIKKMLNQIFEIKISNKNIKKYNFFIKNANNTHIFYYSILMFACELGKINIVNYLCDYSKIYISKKMVIPTIKYIKCNINLQNKYGNSAIFIACRKGYFEIVKKLCEKGANINIQNKEGNTPIIIAIKNIKNNKIENIKIIKYLCENGANINLGNKNENTPIMFAILMRNKEIIKYLCEKGANINTVNYRGISPLMLEIINNCSKEEQIEIEIENIEVENTKIENIEDIEIIQYLCEKEANINIKDLSKYTPIIYAIMTKNINLVKYLYENSANINTQTTNGITPLMFAIMNEYRENTQNMEIVEYLYKNGAEINIKSIFGNNEVMTAIIHFNNNNDKDDKLNIVKYLCKKGCKINIINNDGKTALKLAFENTNDDRIINFLMEYYLNIDNFEKFTKYCLKKSLLNNSKENIILSIDISEIPFFKLIEYIYMFIISCPIIDTNNINMNMNMIVYTIIDNKENIKLKEYIKLQNLFTKIIFGYITYKYYKKIDNIVPNYIYILPPIILNEINNSNNVELKKIIDLINKKDSILEDMFSIKYEGQNGSNYGGLLRTFFTNIQISLNNIYEIKSINNKIREITENSLTYESNRIKNIEKIKEEKIELENEINKKEIEFKNKTNKSNNDIQSIQLELKTLKYQLSHKKNLIIRFEREISRNILNKKKKKFNIDIKKLTDRKNNIHIKNIENINNIQKIKILKISKINNNPIYLSDNFLKEKILNEILRNNNNKYNEIIKKVLNFDIKSNFSKDLINNSFNSNNLNEKDDSNNEDIKFLIDMIENDEERVYEDLIDFFISHFIVIRLNINNIIKKMEFNNNFINIDENDENNTEFKNFKKKFILLLKRLNEEELKIFNKFISGSFIEQSRYVINIYKKKQQENNTICRILQHTCFSTIDIINYSLFIENFIDNSNLNKSKNKFVEYMKICIESGFTII